MWGCQDVKPTGILLQKGDKQAASHPHCPETTPKPSQNHISTLSQRKLVYSLQKNTAQKWPDMQRSLHFIAVCHPAALVTPSWKQPWNPEDAQACPKQLSPRTRDQTTAMSRLNIVDSGILWTVLSLTFYHSVQHIMLVILQLRSNEKLTLK